MRNVSPLGGDHGHEPALRRWLLVAVLAATVSVTGWVGGEEGERGAAVNAAREPVPPTARLAASGVSDAEAAGNYAAKLRQRAIARESVDIFADRVSGPLVKRATDPIRVPVVPYIYVGRIVQHGQVSALLEAEGRIRAIAESRAVDGDYRIDEIREDTISLTYLPLGIKQTLQLRAFAYSAQPADVAVIPASAMGRQARRARLVAASVAAR